MSARSGLSPQCSPVGAASACRVISCHSSRSIGAPHPPLLPPSPTSIQPTPELTCAPLPSAHSGHLHSLPPGPRLQIHLQDVQLFDPTDWLVCTPGQEGTCQPGRAHEGSAQEHASCPGASRMPPPFSHTHTHTLSLSLSLSLSQVNVPHRPRDDQPRGPALAGGALDALPALSWASSALSPCPSAPCRKASAAAAPCPPSLRQLECLKQCGELLKRGASVLFFPEGTRSKVGASRRGGTDGQGLRGEQRHAGCGWASGRQDMWGARAMRPRGPLRPAPLSSYKAGASGAGPRGPVQVLSRPCPAPAQGLGLRV